jgi:hypothetical protein
MELANLSWERKVHAGDLAKDAKKMNQQLVINTSRSKTRQTLSHSGLTKNALGRTTASVTVASRIRRIAVLKLRLNNERSLTMPPPPALNNIPTA